MSKAASPPPVLGTLESALYADDLDASVAFWEGVIGLTCFQRRAGRHAFFRVTDTPHPQILLVFRAEATEKPAAPDAPLPVPTHGARGPGHVCLAAEAGQMDAWRAHLIAAGIAIEADFLWPNGARSIYVRDPAGNSIEIAEPRLWRD